jgi:hypothetical protein
MRLLSMPAAEQRRYGLLLALLCTLLPVPGMPDAAAGAAPATQLVRLAHSLVDAPDPMRSDFAWLALSEMVAIYTEQAARARLESRAGAQAYDRTRWAAAVEAYAAQMQALANGFTPDTRVRISVGAGNAVHVYVDGRPVIVTGVIDGQQAAYEQRVLERFCVLYLCAELLQQRQLAEPRQATAAAAAAAVHWSFSQHAGPVCLTDDGLEFQFHDTSDLKRRRRACEQAVAELNVLAAAISRELAAGVRVDWNGLLIRELPGALRHQVRLNPEGATIELALPALALTPDLFRVLRPWLAARSAGSSYPLVVLNAEQLVAPLMASYE